MGSHTWHQQRWESRLYPQPKQVLDLATLEGCKSASTYWNVNVTANRPGIEPRPVSRKSNALLLSHHATRGGPVCDPGAAIWWTGWNICILSLILAHSLHYVKTLRHSQNRMYIMYCTAIRGPSHGHSKFGEIRTCIVFKICQCSDKETDRQTDTMITILCTTAWGQSNNRKTVLQFLIQLNHQGTAYESSHCSISVMHWKD